MQRVLGEVTHVDKVVWDWRDQAGWVRFKPGKVADEQALKDAIQYGTMYTSGEVRYVRRVEDLPDELR